MGKIKIHSPVKLITGFIFKDEPVLEQAVSFLERRFGKMDFESPALKFIHTDYYQAEFGKDLSRKFVSFKKLISPDELARIKIFTNKIEEKLSQGSRRRINIDPGYLDLAKLVLATTKDYAHRIYLNKGIYAEVTLVYQDKMFKPQSWTYPDYRTTEYLEIFNRIRDIYAQQK